MSITAISLVLLSYLIKPYFSTVEIALRAFLSIKRKDRWVVTPQSKVVKRGVQSSCIDAKIGYCWFHIDKYI